MRPIHTLHALAVVALRRTNFVVIKIALRDFPPLLFPALMVLGGLSIITATRGSQNGALNFGVSTRFTLPRFKHAFHFIFLNFPPAKNTAIHCHIRARRQ